MKEISGWECSDGKRFFDEKEAQTHQTMIYVGEWLSEDPDFFGDGLEGIGSPKELLEFLQRNEERILALMGWRRPLPCKYTMLIGGGYLCTTCDKKFDDVSPRCLNDW